MHILLMVLSVLAAGAFWWFRMKTIASAGSEALDAAGRFRGKMRRNKLRNQAEESPVVAIDNPVIAASTLIINLVYTHPMPPTRENSVREQINQIADGELLDEAIVYGRWVQSQGLDRRKTTTMLCEKLNGWLNFDERGELIDMIKTLDRDPDIILQKDNTELAIRKLNA